MERCPYCGTLLSKTNFKRYFCPNCGIVGKDEDAYEPEDEEKHQSYVG